MKNEIPCVLTINAGSSSIRFALYQTGETIRLKFDGKVERLETGRASITARGGPPRPFRPRNPSHAVDLLLNWLEKQPEFTAVRAVGHRVVHGMRHCEPERVTPRLIAELHRITPYAPDHLPRETQFIEAVSLRHPALPQVACFDTAFHRTMPRVAKMLAIPRRYFYRGIERYGFHGLSYAYLMEELARLDPAAARGRVVLAHLGSGSSLAAVLNGKSIDTSMGFTPCAGVMMSTRSGDVDPGLEYYLSRTEGMTPARFQQMVNHESGLLGISGSCSDMRDLLVRDPRDIGAAEAVESYCYGVKLRIGSYAAALGGLDTLVFAGGIGENAAAVRERVCEGLEFLGIKINRRSNERNSALISSPAARVKVRVINTDEELMIARCVGRVLDIGSGRKVAP